MIYAINKRTKEHRIYRKPMDADFWAECELVQSDADGWIPWLSGQDQPVADGALVEARERNGHVWPADEADAFCWKSDSDIIAYRPILDAKPEAPAWDGEGLPPVGIECEFEHAEEGNWIDAKVIGYDGPACVVALDGYGYAGSDNPRDFRPIRSEEDKEIDRIKDIIADEFDADRRDCYLAARALYSAGYRRAES